MKTAGMACHRERNTPITDSAKPAVAVATLPLPVIPPDRKYLLERVEEAAVVQLYADGFVSLSLLSAVHSHRHACGPRLPRPHRDHAPHVQVRLHGFSPQGHFLIRRSENTAVSQT